MQQLDPAVKTIWSLALVIRTVFFTAAALALDIYSNTADGVSVKLPLGVLTGLVMLTGITISVLIPILRYKYWRFNVSDDELYVERGILTRVRTLAPVVRIQHLDVSQNVIEQYLGIGKLVVYTAGTRGADIVIPGLPYDYAVELRDRLKNYSIEDAV